MRTATGRLRLRKFSYCILLRLVEYNSLMHRISIRAGILTETCIMHKNSVVFSTKLPLNFRNCALFGEALSGWVESKAHRLSSAYGCLVSVGGGVVRVINIQIEWTCHVILS